MSAILSFYAIKAVQLCDLENGWLSIILFRPSLSGRALSTTSQNGKRCLRRSVDDGIVGGGAGEFEAVRPLFVGADAGCDCGASVGVRWGVCDAAGCGVGGRVGGSVRARAAAAEAASAGVHPVICGCAGDDEPEEFRVGRDGEFGCAGGSGEGVAIDAGAGFPGGE